MQFCIVHVKSQPFSVTKYRKSFSPWGFIPNPTRCSDSGPRWLISVPQTPYVFPPTSQSRLRQCTVIVIKLPVQFKNSSWLFVCGKTRVIVFFGLTTVDEFQFFKLTFMAFFSFSEGNSYRSKVYVMYESAKKHVRFSNSIGKHSKFIEIGRTDLNLFLLYLRNVTLT